jgi:hypothetical protein
MNNNIHIHINFKVLHINIHFTQYIKIAQHNASHCGIKLGYRLKYKLDLFNHFYINFLSISQYAQVAINNYKTITLFP